MPNVVLGLGCPGYDVRRWSRATRATHRGEDGGEGDAGDEDAGKDMKSGADVGNVNNRDGMGTRSRRRNETSEHSSVVSSQVLLGKRAPMFYVPEVGGLGSLEGRYVELSMEETKHATMVLRLQEGAEVQLCDGRGTVVNGVVASVGGRRGGGKSVGGKRAQVRITTSTKNGTSDVMEKTGDVVFHVGVACGTLKGSRGDWMVEKCAEIGARRMTPLVTARGRGEGGEGRYARYERLAISVMKQSLQGWKMEVGDVCGLSEFLGGLLDGEGRNGQGGERGERDERQEKKEHEIQEDERRTVVFVGAESGDSFWEVLTGLNRKVVREVVILVGPEGDFTPDEMEGLLARGVRPVRVGSHRLRTETAAIVLLSAAKVALGGD